MTVCVYLCVCVLASTCTQPGIFAKLFCFQLRKRDASTSSTRRTITTIINGAEKRTINISSPSRATNISSHSTCSRAITSLPSINNGPSISARRGVLPPITAPHSLLPFPAPRLNPALCPLPRKIPAAFPAPSTAPLPGTLPPSALFSVPHAPIASRDTTGPTRAAAAFRRRAALFGNATSIEAAAALCLKLADPGKRQGGLEDLLSMTKNSPADVVRHANMVGLPS